MPTDDQPRLTDLRAEHRVRPVGLDVPPRFSWTLVADRRGCAQRGHRLVVRVGDDPVWDSGEVPDHRGYEVAYGGPPLTALTRYDWTVTVHTPHGDAEASSWFVSGLPDPADWAGAAWIGRPAADGAAPLLRHEFTLDDSPATAHLAVAAGGYASVTLNGVPVADEVLSPGFTDYTRRVQYVVHDVTRLLRPGRNALGVELGRGFFGVRRPNTWDWHTAPWHGEPRVRLLLATRGPGGAVTPAAVSSPDWRAVAGPIRDDDVYGGESHDDRYLRPGFDLPGHDDAGWSPATVLPAPAGRLEHQRQQPIRVVAELPAEEVDEPEPGVYVARFPRVVAGWAAVRVPATPAGATVTVRYGERLTEAGRPHCEDVFGHYSGRFQTDRFTLAGTVPGPESGPESGSESAVGSPAGAHRCEPRFTYKGFRYVEITGWPADAPPPAPADLVARVVHSDVAVTGAFTCSDPDLTRLHELTVATVLNNLHGIPTDTPMYEKNGWTGDAMLGAEIFLRNLDVHELLAKWLQDVADTREPGGHPQVIAPHGGWRLSWEPAPTWHSAFVLIPWWLHRHTGDARVLATHFDGMAEYARFELARSPGGIATTTLGDWVSPESPPPGGNPPDEDLRVPATAYLYAMLTTLDRAAGVLGRPAEEEFFRARAAEVRAAFRERFVDSATGLVRGEGEHGTRQSHQALALAFGLLDADERAAAAALLAADVAGRGDRLNTGALGTKYLLPMLTAHGHAARALAVARQPEFPGWGLWLRAGATSLWEHWGLEARSRGHYFLGTIDDWLFADVAGLSVTGPDDLLVRPALTGLLDAAAARLPTPRGPAEVAWRRADGVLTLDVTVPAGASARVHLPTPNADPTTATESGRPLPEAEGVRVLRGSPGTAEVVLTVPGGRYTFAAPA
ncbi:family 78 glycoside hydrolase catalytic domain [Streptomyces sp. B6B3]|uniref:family 78 glycoside hydrolase catalytic domain n=1 Tax=Streptomyces sp. B6B3 TaxID=3153570 RepID=UPI00325E80B9